MDILTCKTGETNNINNGCIQFRYTSSTGEGGHSWATPIAELPLSQQANLLTANWPLLTVNYYYSVI